MEMKVETDWIELWQGSHGFKNVPHRHEDWMQVTLPIKGTVHFTQEERSYGLKQGNGLLQPPGTEHHFYLGEQSSVIIVKIRERGAGGMESIGPQFAAGEGQDIRQEFHTGDMIGRFRQWMMALIEGQALADPLAVQEVEQDVVAYLGGMLKLGKKEPLPPGISDPHILRALTYLHDCYENMINIDELAGIALQSRYHFIRSFREATGTTPYQYLLRLRISEAMNRLRRSDATIGQISVDLGFSSTSQFHRAFLKMTGVTPQVYRQQ
ncbi:helix-turn-helix domain-containing protein [Paenibacillus glycanilyticus]|uniref:AraC family transcriptional regulator n=1 Tax=Paenibacillus glycanilyticus TaxID=126569 RepID=UPI00203DFDE5|nr:AraC family transcriptional regulator [Paenibacillus glycanilyticus]MCM3630815.1 helix-turn-helix domain-containing protein [Paenibacillus glycanilyticus]